MPNKKITLIAESLAVLLIKENKKLALAESCTGGWIAKVVTDLSGSSAWFDRGFVTYSNEAKHEMLGVAAITLDSFGAVSQETVSEMAIGALKNSHADYSLSVSGIAGPDGGSADKPVGLVWFAWADKDGTLLSEKQTFIGDRNAVREQAVTHALTYLLKLLNETAS